ncbi:hypothetical protein GCK32_020209, partial [Trichostrongylus colubriformis]
MKKINAKVKRTLWHDRKCLIKCKGGKVDLKYLQQFDKFCDEIDGDLIIEGLQDIPTEIEKLAQIEKIHGRLIVRNNTALQDLSYLPYLKTIYNPDTR